MQGSTGIVINMGGQVQAYASIIHNTCSLIMYVQVFCKLQFKYLSLYKPQSMNVGKKDTSVKREIRKWHI